MAQFTTSSPAALPERFRFRRADYYRMAEAGIIGPDERVELLDGEVLRMSPIGYRHALIVDRLVRFFFDTLGDRVDIRVQNPVALDEHSEPEPDVALLRPEDERLGHDHPGPADVFLIVEVADSSLHRDRAVKLPLYAAAGVREVWLIDLATYTLTTHRQPHAGAYACVEAFDREARPNVSPQSFPDVTLDLAHLLR